jgi:cobalt-zinc-cadmium efflux system membrane fusion protein
MNRILAAALLVSSLALLSCRSEAEPAAATEAKKKTLVDFRDNPETMRYLALETVKVEDLELPLSLSGRIAFDEDKTQRVASPIDGRVHQLKVKLGEVVKAGQPLIEISSPQVAQLLSDLKKAEEDHAVAEKSYARAKQLREDGAVSEKDFAQAGADLNKSDAELGRVRLQLRVLGISDTGSVLGTLHAEVAGRVVERNVLAGQEIRADAAQPLLTISDLTSVWAVAEVYEQDLSLVKVGDPVEVRVPAWPDQVFPGKVQHIGEVVDPTSHTVRVRCAIANEGLELKPDMFATVAVKSGGGQRGILVPTAAVLASGEKYEVVAAQGKAGFAVRRVRVGSELDGRVRVVAGLSEGDVIVTRGALFARQELQDP